LTGTIENEPDKDGNVQIKAGIMKVRTNISNLRLFDERQTSKPIEISKFRTVKKAAEREIKGGLTEIDVRGKIGDDAWFEIDRFLDDAVLSGLESVRVIHGKGTGALRAALHKSFGADRRIASFRLGQYGEGDSGVTVIEFK
jgi:DNA mismatch repair protein MutS2